MAARSYRLDPDTLELMHLISRRLGVPETTVIRLGVRRLAQMEGVELERLAQPMPTPPVRITDQGQPSGRGE